MVAGGISSGKQRNPRGFMTVLSSAASEWFLIFLLFLDAALSYLITKFASYYGLQTPCMLCSRFDNIFGDKKTGCYKRHLCTDHKEEISFQVFCHVHSNLADIRAMCEECLVSFATEDTLGKEPDILLMAKLGNKNFIPTSFGPWICSCCQKTWRARSSAQRLLQLTSVGFGASKANVKPPLPRTPGRSRFSRRDSFKKIRDKISGPESPRARAAAVDPLSHVGYTELKITSDSESEIQVSDDDDGCSAVRAKNDSRSENNIRHGKGMSQKLGTEAAAPESQARQSSESSPSLLDQPVQLTASSSKNVSFQASDDFVGHGLSELDWETFSPKASPSVLPELISLPHVLEGHKTSGESSKPNTFLPHISDLSILSEIISATNIPSLSSINFQESNLADANDEENNLSEKNDAKAPASLEDCAPSISNQHIETDVSAPSYGGRKLSDRSGEQTAISDAAKAETDLADANDEGNNLNEKNNAKAPAYLDGSAPSTLNQKIQADIIAPSHEEREVSDGPGEPNATSDAAKAGEAMKSLPQEKNLTEANDEGNNINEKDNAKTPAYLDGSAPSISNQKIQADISAPNYRGRDTSDRLREPTAISDAAKAGEAMKSLPQETYLTEAKDEGNNITEKHNAKAPVCLDDCAPSISNQNIRADLSALNYKSGEVSNRLAEPTATSNAAKATECIKLLPQVSTPGMDELQTASQWNHDHNDDHQRSDASSSDGVRMTQLSTFLGDDSGNEPADGFSIGEIEGESIVDRLKRQIEHDQRCINALYKELEEERSASAIAANQAMAMMTRLQEEKAALHMEALQYLRMMEEQAEYDMEALERANDLLAEREKELQDLEAELDLYRSNFPDELSADDPQKENKNLKGEKVTAENHSLDHDESKLNGSSDSKTIKISKISEKPRQFKDSIRNFEDEKLRISQHLKNLEKKLFQVSRRQASDNVPYSGYSDSIKKDVEDQVKKQADDGRCTDSQQENSSSSTRNDFSKSNGGSIDEPADLDMEKATVSEVVNHTDIKHKKVSSLGGEIDVAALGNEISELNGRLQALENDCNFLMHAFNSLQNGHDGVQFIQEIADRLQEIRKIEFMKR